MHTTSMEFSNLNVTIPGLHLPLFVTFKLFPALAALHFAALNMQMLPYVFPSEPQIGKYSKVHILGQSESAETEEES